MKISSTDSSTTSQIATLEKKLISLKIQEESERVQNIVSRKAFYVGQANMFGKIMTVVYKIEMIHSRSVPICFTRSGLMLDFYSYENEKGLDAALLHVLRILKECEE